MIPNAKSKSFVMSDNEWDMTTRYGRGDKGAIVGSKEFLTGTMVGQEAQSRRVTLHGTGTS